MSPPSLPDEIILGPFAWRVTQDQAEWNAMRLTQDKDIYGYCDNVAQVIYLQPGLHPHMLRAVLLHESLHAASFASGQAYKEDLCEEDWVLRVSPMWLDALRRSDGLAEFLVAP